ncbi:hypothetical protein ACN47E_007496 [Coniothyrium glycines]
MPSPWWSLESTASGIMNVQSTASAQALRPLLPAPAGVRRTVFERSRRTNNTDACKVCRQRKTKCDGQRPECSKCIASASECVYAPTVARKIRQRYTQLQAQRNSYEDLVNLLRDIPEGDFLDILRRIRAGDDAHDILRHVQGGNLLMQLCVAPETRHRYDFPYRPAMPITLQVPENHALHSRLYTAIQAFEETSPTRNDSVLFPSPYVKPLHAAEMIDPLLAKAIPSMWTKVSSNDDLLRKLLEAFFVYEYPWMTAFHKDYFLEDMASGNTDFCSSLLVNAVLAKACTTFQGIEDRFMFWEPQNLGYRFLAEARRLWEMVAEEASLTTVQAGYLITATYNVNGLDRIGRSYTAQALAMAEQLGLFHDDAHDDRRFRKAKAITGWSLFSWQFLLCYYDFRPPYIINPPTCLLPDPYKDPEWYPEISNYQQQLETWYKKLPDVISLHAMVFPVHFQIHCFYRMVLVMLFDIERDAENDQNSLFTGDQRHAAKAVMTQADVQLETILRLYYARHSFQDYDSQLMMQLTYLGNVALKGRSHADDGSDSNSQETLEATRSTLALVLKGLYEQSRNYHIGLSALQIMKGQIGAHDRTLLAQFAASEATKYKEIPLEAASVKAQLEVLIKTEVT